MQYITEIQTFEIEKASAVTLGKFDSLHMGHQKLIRKIQEYAHGEEQSVVFAFDMHQNSLLTNEERKEHLENMTDIFIECPFTTEIREMEAEKFIKEILVDKLKVRHVVVGPDYCFGYQKKGNVEMLRKYADQYGYQVDVLEKERHHGREISSTYIREAIGEGKIQLANEMLGYTYSIYGTVEAGRRLGRTLGFPTMNLAPQERKILPRNGVYACRVCVEGNWYDAIGNVGIKPTVQKEHRLLTEVFAFGYTGDAYGKEIKVEFCEFERSETQFKNVNELKQQVERDIQFGKEFFAKG